MPRPTRRDFLGTTGAVLAGASLHAPGLMDEADETGAGRAAAIPPHRPIHLPGVHAYTDRVSVPAGEMIRFHVSSTHPYELQVCRLGVQVDDPSGDEALHSYTNST